MKKLLVLLFALFTFAISYAQNNIGTYHCSYYDYDCSIFFDYDSSGYIISLEVFGSVGDKVCSTLFEIDGENNIRQFIAALESMKKQFIKWSSEAKQSGRKGYEKQFDVNLPYFTVAWDYSGLRIDRHPTPKPRFIVTDSGQCSAVISGVATASDNENIKNNYVLVLSSVSDFDTLISSIQIEKLDDYYLSLILDGYIY